MLWKIIDLYILEGRALTQSLVNKKANKKNEGKGNDQVAWSASGWIG